MKDSCGFTMTFMGTDQRCGEPPYSDWHNPSSPFFKHDYEHECGDALTDIIAAYTDGDWQSFGRLIEKATQSRSGAA